jgi:hypothetical protein
MTRFFQTLHAQAAARLDLPRPSLSCRLLPTGTLDSCARFDLPVVVSVPAGECLSCPDGLPAPLSRPDRPAPAQTLTTSLGPA